MGWGIEEIGLRIALRLDEHGGDKEREHEQLAKELSKKLRQAELDVISDPKYSEILLYSLDYYATPDEDE